MSHLDALAEALGLGPEQAKQFARAVRAAFDAAPGLGEILRAVRQHPGGRPSVGQVVAAIKRHHTARAATFQTRTGAHAPSAAKRPARGRRERKPMPPKSLHHKRRYSRKKPAGP